jgi:hypothetical protein
MTIRKPEPTIINRILKLFGIDRKMELPEDYQQLIERFGPYVQIRAKWQSLWDMIRKR